MENFCVNYVYERNLILCIFNEIFIFVKNAQYVWKIYKV